MVDYPLLLNRSGPLSRLEGQKLQDSKGTGQSVRFQIRGNEYTPLLLSHWVKLCNLEKCGELLKDFEKWIAYGLGKKTRIWNTTKTAVFIILFLFEISWPQLDVLEVGNGAQKESSRKGLWWWVENITYKLRESMELGPLVLFSGKKRGGNTTYTEYIKRIITLLT